jgi:hypothetical protein
MSTRTAPLCATRTPQRRRRKLVSNSKSPSKTLSRTGAQICPRARVRLIMAVGAAADMMDQADVVTMREEDMVDVAVMEVARTTTKQRFQSIPSIARTRTA